MLLSNTDKTFPEVPNLISGIGNAIAVRYDRDMDKSWLSTDH